MGARPNLHRAAHLCKMLNGEGVDAKQFRDAIANELDATDRRSNERAAKLVEAERDAKWPDGEPLYVGKLRDRLTRLAEQIRSGDDG